MAEPIRTAQPEFFPLTLERWDDFVDLFGPNGACSGCWCMFWRQTRQEFRQNAGMRNREAMHALVASGQVPGILIYQDGQLHAWCSIAPREHFASLQRSRTLKRLDAQPVLSIVCFYIARKVRRAGLMDACIRAGIRPPQLRGYGGSLSTGCARQTRRYGPLYGQPGRFLARAGLEHVEERGAHVLVRASLV